MTDDEALFDAYLDLALQGRAGTPDAFLAERGLAGPASEATRERLEAIHRAMGAGPRVAAGEANGGPADAATARDPDDLSDGALDSLLREASSHGGTTSDGALDPGLQAGRLAPGQVLGDYVLERPLGGGGMGIVWLAEQRSLGRRVALKLIRPELVSSATSVERFRREAQAAARVNHPHAVAIYEHGVMDGLAFMAMEYVDGEGLDEVIARARQQGTSLVTTDALRWAAELAEALEAAHQAGLVHRDVKPSNVRLDAAGRARLLDFGVVRLMDGVASTLTGAFAGSPPYAAPEQISGVAEDIDARTDLYALGVLLYECLTGQVPFEGLVTEQLFHRILVQEPPAPRTLRPDLPRDVEVVVLTCLEKRPERRYASARELAADLRALLELRPVAARPPGPLRRLGRWRRSHPLMAGGLVVLLVLSLVLTGWRVADGLAESERQRSRALGAVVQATGLVDDYEQRVGQREDWVRPTLQARTSLHSQWFPPDARRRTEQDFARLADLDRRREQAFQAGLDALQLADLLDAGRQPDLAEELRQLRARHYRNRLVDLAERGPRSQLEVLAELVDRYDEEGRYEQLLRPRQTVRLAMDPPDGQLYAFRWASQSDVMEGGEPRLVPVPVGPAELPVAPGRWCLEVRADVAPLRRGDLVVAAGGHELEGLLVAPGGPGQLQRGDRVLSVDGVAVADLADLASRSARREDGARRRFEVLRRGSVERCQAEDLQALGRVTDGPGLAREVGTPLTVLRDGELLELASPGPFAGRLTAAPLLVHPDNDLAVGAGREVELPDEPLLLLGRHPGRATRRSLLDPGVTAAGGTATLRLLPPDVVPPGFVVIDPTLADTSLRVERPLLLAEREVTAAEYLEFLNDPSTLADVEDAETTVRVPRSISDQHTGGSWPRGADGRFRLPADLDPRAPVMGISWHDAVAYCAWLDRRAAAAGSDLSHRLPSGDEWTLAASGGTNREYPFGDSFRSWWTKSCFSRPTATVEPVLSYPVDESPFGVFDLAGSAQEWCQDWWVQATNRRRYAGGAWPFSNDGTHFRCWGANGGVADVGYLTVGLRVAADSPALDPLRR